MYTGGVAVHREIERTYAPGPGDRLTDLSRLPGVVGLGEPETVELTAVYFDTHDLRLTRAGVSLRRRVGGHDEGWHLKVPAEVGRDEIRLPLRRSASAPPKELRELVQGWTRGVPLEAVATIRTHRTTYPLLGEGVVPAEVADDEVTGKRADGETVCWREWELELVEGDVDLLAAADELMAAAGIGLAEVSRKIERTLGDLVPAPDRLPRPKPRKPAARLVHRRLAAQVEELGRRDVDVRRGDPEGVHDARVACRRLRSLLATFRPLLDPEVTDPVREEIKWFAQSLSEARDAAVVQQRLAALLEEEPAGLVLGPVARRLRATYGPRARATPPAALSSPRYFALRDRLDRLVADPPWSQEAERSAREIAPDLVRRDWKRLRKRYDRAAVADDRDVALHETRKAAKRLRYAAETVAPVFGKDAKRLVKAAKKLTTHLGERQDTVVSREQLLQLAMTAAAEVEPTFTYGRLHAREQHRATELDAGLPDVWSAVSRPKLRSFLR